MGHPGLDAQTSLDLIQTLLYCLACILGGSVLLGLAAYIVFLCSEIFASQPTSKARLAKLPQPLAYAPVAEENAPLFAAKAANGTAEGPLGEGAVRTPALPDRAHIRTTPVPLTAQSETAGRSVLLSALILGGSNESQN